MFGNCKLCEQNTNIRQSHIIPEWGYKNLYDSKHRLLILSKNIFYPSFKQNGVKEYLLCDECEQHFSKIENYSKKIYTFIHDNCSENITGKNNNDYCWIIKNVNYNILKHFFLSVLYRMIVSKDEMFKYYYQDKEKTENLRMSLFRTNIPNHFYPIIISKPYIMNNYIDNVLYTQSCNGKLHGYPTFWVMFCGILITIINSENIYDINILNNALKEGEFLIHKTNVDNIVDTTFLTKIILENNKVQDYYFNNNY